MNNNNFKCIQMGGKNCQFTFANGLCRSSSLFPLADLNLYSYPYFQTANSNPDLDLHKPFVQVKLSAFPPSV